MKPYDTSYSPILGYYAKISSGEIVVCQKIKRQMKKLVDDLLDDSKSEYEYNPERAEHAIDFIERYCKHSKGKWGGQPLLLELWQKAIMSAAYGFIHKIDGTRQYREVLLVVARKNGKSTMSSGNGVYLQVGDGEPGAEIYAVATKKDQAKIVWLESKRMIKKSPILLKRIKPLVSDLVCEWNDSSFKPLGSDSETLDGLNVHGALMDEIHAWTDKNLYDVIVDGTSAREEPLIWMITTAGTVRESVYDMKYEEAERVINGYDDENGYKDPHFLPFIYELDHRDEWTDETCWIKANPGLGTIKSVEALKSKVEKAKADPRLVKNLLCKDFNIRETSSESWLNFEQLNNNELFDISVLKPNYAIGGVDLSATTDLTAAKIIFMKPNDPKVYVLQMYWLPEDLLEQRAKEDKIPYDIWYDLGLLRLTEGNSVHPKYVTEWFLEMQQQYDFYVSWIGYDAWAAKYWVEEMEGYFGKNAMIAVPQTRKVMSIPMKILEADLSAKRVIYNNNPIDKWCLSNTAIEVDKNLNIQPVKTSNSRRRIDGTVALVNAYVVLQDKKNDYMNLI